MSRRIITPGIDFEWRSDSLVFNLFRVWELLFGAPYGIRRTANVAEYVKDGRLVVERAFYTWEALLSYWEVTARHFFRTLKIPKFQFVPVQQLVAVGPMGPAMIPVYSFAIARDVNSAFNAGTGTTTKTFTAVNVTGSNPAVVHGGTFASSDTLTGSTFNSVTMTNYSNQNGAGRWSYLTYLAGTGGNASVAMTFSAEPDFSGAVTSAYSGVTPGAADSAGQADASSTTSLTVSTTVVATDCWLAGWFYVAGGTGIAAGTGASEVADNANDNLGFYDSNTTVGTGSQSMQVTASSGNWAGLMASFAPAAAAATGTFRRRLLTGIGA